MEAQPTQPTLESHPEAAALSASSVGGSADGEHQVDLEEEQRQQQLEHVHRSDSGIPRSEQGEHCSTYLFACMYSSVPSLKP